MKSKKSKIIILCLLLIVGIGFFINSSFSFFKKTKTQEEDNIVTTNCFEVALINDTNGINLTNAYPVKDEDGLKMSPYTFTVKNVCQNEENVFIQLDMNKDNTVNYSHVKISLDGDATLPPTLLNELVTSNTISDEVSDEYDRAKIMTTKKLAPEEQITLNLRMWLDYEKSDIGDQNALFTSKVEIITPYRTEDVNTMPYIESDTKYVGNKTVEATYHFKSDSVNVVGYAISEVETDNLLWINIEEKTKDYEVIMNYTENKTYYLYVKDERGNVGSKVVVIDPSDKEKPVINGVKVTANIDSEISVNNSINIEVDAIDDTEIVKYYYSLDNETYVEVSDSTYTFTDLAQDDYIVYVYVEDSSGNKSLVYTESLRVGTPAVRNVNTGVEYFSIEKGAIASNDGDTLIALRNIKESANIPTGKNFTFDIAGYTITRVDDTIIDLYGDSVLRITDSTWDSEHPYGKGKFTKGDSNIIAGVGAIYTVTGTTLNLDHVTISENIAKNNGGALSISGIANVDNCLISSNTANTVGGGINIGSGANVTISNTLISSNEANDAGGGIAVASGTNVTISDSEIKSNKAKSVGGGITISSGANVTVSNSTINSNESNGSGGGLLSNGSLKLNEGTIVENNTSASNGGGIYIYENSASDPVDFQMHEGVIIRNNNAGESSSGGGIYLAAISSRTIDGGLIEGNTAKYGAGIYVSNSKSNTNLSNLTIQNNIASYSGGGLRVNASSSVFLNDSNINNNSAVKYGGGINIISGGNIEINNTNIDSNDSEYGGGLFSNGTLKLNDGTIIKNNTSASDGGGIYIYESNTSNPADFQMHDGVEIKNNKTGVNSYGGGIYLVDISSHTIDGGVIEGNTSKYGGGIFVNNSKTDINLNNLTIQKNTASYSGGGLSAGALSVANLNNLNINNNSAVKYGGGINIYSGGNIEINNTSINTNNSELGGGIFANGSLKLNDGTMIENNTGTGNGGGVYIYENNASNPVDFQMHDGVIIRNNKAGENSYGGGIYFASISTSTIDGGLIEGNTAASGAGMRLSNSKSVITLNNLTVQNNTSTGSGGGIRSSYNVVLNNIDINSNKGSTGGGIYADGNLEFNSGVISNNTSSNHGGGIYIIGSETSPVAYKMHDGAVIRNNQSGSGYHGGGLDLNKYTTVESDGGLIEENSAGIGGGVNVHETSVTLTNLIIRNNTSNSIGGAIRVDNLGFLTLDRVIIEKNEAATDGGGIYVYNTGGLTINNSQINGNTAKTAGAIYLDINLVTTITDSSINNNSATTFGGGIFAKNDTQLILNNTLIDNNESEGDGGGINTNGAITLNDGTVISNNFSNRLGGGISMYNSDSFTMNGNSKIIGNIAVTGGGISFNQVSQAIIENGLIDNNEAMNGGGGIYTENTSMIMNNGQISNNMSHGNGGGIYSGVGSAITINDGLIDRNQALTDEYSTQNVSGYGAGIFVKSTVFMNGGTLSNNVASDNGGAVQVNVDGNFIMNGGTIKTNSAKKGGGIDSFYDLTIKGGEINDNTCSGNGCGSAIDIGNGTTSENIPTLNLTGGRVSGNTCSATNNNLCGAVTLNGSKSEYKINVNISGNPVISGNVDGNGNNRDLIYNHNSLMYINGPMTDGANIGVGNIGPATYSTIATYTDSAGSIDYKDYFFSNISGYNISFDAANRIIKFVS